MSAPEPGIPTVNPEIIVMPDASSILAAVAKPVLDADASIKLPVKVNTVPLTVPHGFCRVMLDRIVPPARRRKTPFPESSIAETTPCIRKLMAIEL
jgi:hypothetical protein